MEIINDILNDYSEYCHQKLTEEFGAYTQASYDPIYLYQRYKCRIIEKRVREIYEANELIVPEKYKTAYKEIVDAIKDGDFLKKFQSRNLKKLDYDDDMLSHWGIQHFHLGQTVKKDGFVQRTGDLLFIHFSQSKAHILGVFDHEAWCDLNLIQIIHNNWPDELAIFQSNSNTRPLSESEHKILRKKHANATVTVRDGTEYHCPGMGVTANGAPINAVLNSAGFIYMLNQEFELIKENIDQILESDPQHRNSETITVGMEFVRENNTIAYKIKETGFVFTLSS